MSTHTYRGAVIPPLTVVRANDDVAKDIYGPQAMRIGYYSRMDGLNCVWLVNGRAEYFATADQRFIRDHFQTLTKSDETDMYGNSRPVLEPLTDVA